MEMKKKRRRSNPVAKDLRTPKYRMRVQKQKTKYKRKEKHRNKPDAKCS